MILFFKAAPVADRYRNQPVLTGYRGIKSPGEMSYGATEGCGLYLTPARDLARQFSATGRAAKFRYRQPINPLIVNGEPMPLLDELPEIKTPVSAWDTTWTALNKQANSFSWLNQTPVPAELTRLLTINGYDAVEVNGYDVNGDPLKWTVLIDPELIATATAWRTR